MVFSDPKQEVEAQAVESEPKGIGRLFSFQVCNYIHSLHLIAHSALYSSLSVKMKTSIFVWSLHDFDLQWKIRRFILFKKKKRSQRQLKGTWMWCLLAMWVSWVIPHDSSVRVARFSLCDLINLKHLTTIRLLRSIRHCIYLVHYRIKWPFRSWPWTRGHLLPLFSGYQLLRCFLFSCFNSTCIHVVIDLWFIRVGLTWENIFLCFLVGYTFDYKLVWAEKRLIRTHTKFARW